MRQRTSRVWSLSKKDFRRLVDASDSIASIARHLGYATTGTAFKAVRQRIAEDGLDVDAFLRRSEKARVSRLRKIGRSKRIPLESVLVKGSKINSHKIKHRLWEAGLLEEKCSGCGLDPEWNGAPLSLHLDHVNGVNDDNRIENLRILCPNCHAQTDTFGTKRFRKDRPGYDSGPRPHARKFDPSKDALADMVARNPMTHVGRFYGVSDNAVRRRCRLLGIPISGRPK